MTEKLFRPGTNWTVYTREDIVKVVRRIILFQPDFFISAGVSLYQSALLVLILLSLQQVILPK